MSLDNHYNLAYSANLYLGSETAKSNVVFDTGSNWLTIATKECSTCTHPRYEPANSTTARR